MAFLTSSASTSPTPQTNKKNPKLLVSKLTGHREYAHKQSDVSAPDHDALASVCAVIVTRTLVLPRGPNAHKQDEDIEDHNSHKTFDVDSHLDSVRFDLVRFVPLRSSAIARE